MTIHDLQSQAIALLSHPLQSPEMHSPVWSASTQRTARHQSVTVARPMFRKPHPKLYIPSEQRLLASLAQACLRELTRWGIEIPQIAHSTWGEAIRLYARVLHRTIPPAPRAVQRSRELEAMLKVEADQNTVAQFEAVEREIREGLDLNVRLSRRFFEFTYNDPLLNDLSIHHLHLGYRSPDAMELCEDTKRLLYCVVERETAYLVYLGDHQSFRQVSFERILFNNWPEQFANLGVNASSSNWTPIERSKGRRSGLTMSFQDGGGSYLPPRSGQTMDGTSIWATLLAGDLANQVVSGREWVTQNLDWVRQNLVSAGCMDKALALEVALNRDQVQFVERAKQLRLFPRRGELAIRETYASRLPRRDLSVRS